MITLYCAVVSVSGSAFPVDIDENKSVGHLKDAIAKEKKMISLLTSCSSSWRRRRTARGCKMTTLVCSSWTKGGSIATCRR
ncbi:hypothetical protein PC123_g27202 [Phytophthora cactorum]|nr:hypothetical protein PC123_g27202 [Phytophthora cactorum]